MFKGSTDINIFKGFTNINMFKESKEYKYV